MGRGFPRLAAHGANLGTWPTGLHAGPEPHQVANQPGCWRGEGGADHLSRLPAAPGRSVFDPSVRQKARYGAGDRRAPRRRISPEAADFDLDRRYAAANPLGG